MNTKKEIILMYTDLLNRDIENAKKEIKDALDKKGDIQVVIDFEHKPFGKEHLEEIFNFIIEYKKNKIILLRNITYDDYTTVEYLKNLNTIKSM